MPEPSTRCTSHRKNARHHTRCTPRRRGPGPRDARGPRSSPSPRPRHFGGEAWRRESMRPATAQGPRPRRTRSRRSAALGIRRALVTTQINSNTPIMTALGRAARAKNKPRLQPAGWPPIHTPKLPTRETKQGSGPTLARSYRRPNRVWQDLLRKFQKGHSRLRKFAWLGCPFPRWAYPPCAQQGFYGAIARTGLRPHYGPQYRRRWPRPAR